MTNDNIFISSFPFLLKGILLNVFIAIFAFLIGIFIAFFLAYFEKSKIKALNLFTKIYLIIFRGTPMLIQIMFFYYVFPQMGILINPLVSVIIAIGLNSGAYLSQIVYSGLLAVSKGQYDAAKVLGMNPFQIYRYILLPQCIRKVLPAFGNEIITLLKDSSLASTVGIYEIVKTGAIIRGKTYESFSIFFMIAIIYIFLTTFVTFFMKKLEIWSKKPCSI